MAAAVLNGHSGALDPQSVSFTSGGVECRGWLYRPAAVNQDVPVVVIAHGYAATHAVHYWRTAEALAEAGYAVLDFDARNLGGSGGLPRQRISPTDQVTDLRSAIAYVRTLPGIDNRRVAVFGSSAGGGVAISLAASDPDVAAVLLVVPHVDGVRTCQAPH